MSTCLLTHLDELVFVVILLGIAEGGTDTAGDLDGEPVARTCRGLPVALLLTPGHWPSDMVKEVVVDLERE